MLGGSVAVMKARTHEQVRGEFITTPADEAELVAYKAEALAEVGVHRLADVRRHRGLTQTEVAARLNISQTAVSKIERGDLGRSELSTIARYVAALGGTVEVTAVVGEDRYRLRP
jgi:DNA-binding XRE family transcriptional regulator